MQGLAASSDIYVWVALDRATKEGVHVRRRTIAIIAAVVLALVAAGLVVWYVSSVKRRRPVPIDQDRAGSAADIPARTTGEAMVANGLVEPQ